jgi:hypothetical protein
MKNLTYLLIAAVVACSAPNETEDTSGVEEWQSIFNGENLDGWTPKFRGSESGVNFNNTFRVQDSLLTASYDEYDSFRYEFGHLFYKEKFSHYRLRTEYRFLPEQSTGGPGWAYANNGLMLHCQPPETMSLNQAFPLSIEFQLLGGEDRPTGKFCSPASNVTLDGVPFPDHCYDAYEGPAHAVGTWVTAEAIVYGDSLIHHLINGDTVLTYTDIVIGGDQSDGLDTLAYPTGTPLAEGLISIQAESHPTQFRNMEVLNLCGCMDPEAKNYKNYYVVNVPESCVYE